MKALVTGASGFLGGAIARALRERGDDVRGLQRHSVPDLTRIGVEVVRGDIADRATVERAAAGVDVIFHVAARAAVWGPAHEFERVNVTGTENVIAACRAHTIGRLVYTSTPSVVHRNHDLLEVDESTPYADHFVAHYPRTKAVAERLVLAANDATLATVALRPHLIWGPGDNHLAPRLIARARRGALCRVGGRDVIVDSVYIDNAVDAHILAADKLLSSKLVAGKAYFISQGQPTALWDLANRILAAAGEPPVTRSLPVWVAKSAGAILDLIYSALGLESEPPMTRFLAHQLSTSHWFDISAARRELGYEPRVSIDEGMARLAKHLSK